MPSPLTVRETARRSVLGHVGLRLSCSLTKDELRYIVWHTRSEYEEQRTSGLSR